MKSACIVMLMIITFATPCLAEMALDVFSSNEGTLWTTCGLPIYYPMSGINSSCSQWGFYQGEPYSCGGHHEGRGYHCLTSVADARYIESPFASILYSFH